MKVLVVLSCIFAACTAVDKEFIAQFLTKAKKVGDECMKEVNGSPDDIKQLMVHQIPTSHEGKCIIFCFHKHFNIQNDDGSFNKAGAVASLQDLKENDNDSYEKVLKIIDTCESVPTDSDPCTYAVTLTECAMKEAKAAGLDQLLMIE